MLCSAIMYAYYLIALRNKKFHQYNRYYLLFAAVFSWIIPLIKINITNTEAKAEPVNNLIQIVASNNTEVENFVVTNNVKYIDWISIVNISYIAVSAVLLFVFFGALVKIFRLLKANSAKQIDGVHLILTNDSSTPFSFFKYIFWNRAIDIQCEEGKQMLQHELTHVREKHSADKIIMQLIIILGWANPVFWIMRRELSMIHEFIADKKAVADGDASTLANMLLYAAYPKQHYLLTNPLFFSPIKRRIIMMTKNTNPKFSYLRRLVILPLLAVVVMLFAFRANNESNVKLDKMYTVVIDAGHGGTDGGAVAPDGTKESDLAIAFAKAVQAANTNKNIKIILSRTEDVTQSVSDKAKFAVENKADLFVSFHMNTSSKPEDKGIEILYPLASKSKFYKESELLAVDFGGNFIQDFGSIKIEQPQTGIWVLQNSGCPSVIIECGYLSNTEELLKLKSKDFQKKMALNSIKAIERYLKKKEEGKIDKQIIEEKRVRDSMYKALISKVGDKEIADDEFDESSIVASATTIHISTTYLPISESEYAGMTYNVPSENIHYTTDSLQVIGAEKIQNTAKPLVLLNGSQVKGNPMKLNILKDNALIKAECLSAEEAVKVYGEKAKEGAVIFTIDKKYFKE